MNWFKSHSLFILAVFSLVLVSIAVVNVVPILADSSTVPVGPVVDTSAVPPAGSSFWAWVIGMFGSKGDAVIAFVVTFLLGLGGIGTAIGVFWSKAKKWQALVFDILKSGSDIMVVIEDGRLTTDELAVIRKDYQALVHDYNDARYPNPTVTEVQNRVGA